jgi:hypothetical protein
MPVDRQEALNWIGRMKRNVLKPVVTSPGDTSWVGKKEYNTILPHIFDKQTKEEEAKAKVPLTLSEIYKNRMAGAADSAKVVHEGDPKQFAQTKYSPVEQIELKMNSLIGPDGNVKKGKEAEYKNWGQHLLKIVELGKNTKTGKPVDWTDKAAKYEDISTAQKDTTDESGNKYFIPKHGEQVQKAAVEERDKALFNRFIGEQAKSLNMEPEQYQGTMDNAVKGSVDFLKGIAFIKDNNRKIQMLNDYTMKEYGVPASAVITYKKNVPSR